MHIFAKLALFLVLLFAPTANAQTDVAGSSDHPLVGRYDGSFIKSYQVKGYEETMMPRDAITRADRGNENAKSVAVAGKLTEIRYDGPADRSILEVVRNYQAALEGAGFSTIFFCRLAECGESSSFWTAGRGSIGMPSQWDSNTYALMKLERAEGNVWAGVFGVETKATTSRPLTPYVALRVMEEKAIETGKIKLVEADKLAQSLGADGRVALYGIEFDHDSDVVKASSNPQIAEIAKYLSSNARAHVLVVGHTDMTGPFQYNRDLSERRAAAVVAKLTGGYGIERDRMSAIGVGPASPIATNRTEEGRARNRRVEIVEIP